MPELPDIVVYSEAIERHFGGERLESLRIASPFLVRSVDPPVSDLEGRRLVGVRRLGKRIVFEFEDAHFAVLHLMIAGRLRLKKRGAKPPGRNGLAAFDFPEATLILTEAGSHKRASLFVVRGEDGLVEHDPGGLEVFDADAAAFAEVLRRENHTTKRALTDPRLFSGIGNAYSDEILHRARQSPVKLTQRLDDDEVRTLFEATVEVLREWVERLREQTGQGFPDKVKAFHPEMAVHGRFREPCPVCEAPVQRIVYSKNESNYCARCQTGGKLLSDRALSRLLKSDWPRTLDELERRG
ncbi:MAG: formamidopyrimidine-DNA glycosylase [Deltaproteobacteria bacterium]|nr:formamidopyrimidine-DNA glycosylase [Deltaproteobacteria bacterium]